MLSEYGLRGRGIIREGYQSDKYAFGFVITLALTCCLIVVIIRVEFWA